MTIASNAEEITDIVISRRALAREGDYEMMPVCACVTTFASNMLFSYFVLSYKMVHSLGSHCMP